jgi:dienelactone hydrolase
MVNRIAQQKKSIVIIVWVFTSLIAFSQQASSAENEKQVKAKSTNQVSFKARSDNKFLLSADYYYQGKKIDKDKSSGVIILHDCSSERSRYTDLAKEIAAQGMHVLSLDFRGYGRSTATGFSQESIKKQAKDIVSYQSDIALIMSYWDEDVSAAYKYLRTKVDKNQNIAIVASGCAASSAVSLAEKFRLSAMVLMTPEMSYGDKERYKNLIDIPTYFISSAHHLTTYNTAHELFVWNGSTHSKMQTFKGNRLDRQLISAKLNLSDDITTWLKLNLR